MWECEYSHETVDYRLLWLRFKQKIWIIPIAILLGAVLTAAGYYCARVVVAGGRSYQTKSVFYIEFGKDSEGELYDYYNYFTWDEVVHMDYFMDRLYDGMNGEYSKEELASYVAANIDSDVRYLYVRCTTHNPELSLRLAAAMEELVPQFAGTKEEFESIQIAQTAVEAKDSTVLRMGNACFLGACLGLGVSVLWILAVLLMDTSIQLPASFERRYHIPCLGAEFMPEFIPNCSYLLKDAAKIAKIPAEETDVSDIMLGGEVSAEVIDCKNPITYSEELDKIRECDKVVLCVRAGRKNDESIRRMLEQMGRQGIRVSAAVLVGADEKLISEYYRRKK